MKKITNIARNTSFLTLALIIQKVISFSYFTILARNLAPENLGKYYFAISFVTIFSIIIDLGFVNVLTREVAKKQDKAEEFLGNIIFIKIPLAIIAIISVIISINLLSNDPATKILVYIMLIPMVLDSFATTFLAVIRAFHTLIFESISSIIFQLVILSFGLYALKSGLSLYWVISSLALASIFLFTYTASILYFKFKIKIFPRYDSKIAIFLIKLAIPFSVFAVMQKLYTYLDTVMLNILAGDYYVGIYQIPFKIIFAFQFLPMAFTASLYPAMSDYWVNNKEQLKVTFERAMNYLIIISLPISFGVIAISDIVISIFREGYEGAVLPMRITMMSLLFLFINFPIGSLLNACDKQKVNTRNMIITTVTSVIINFFLITKYQAVGASITVLFTNILMFVLGIRHVGKIIEYRPLRILKIFVKALISSLVMFFAALYLKERANVFVVAGVGGAIYFSLMFLSGGFKKQDLLSIMNSFVKKKK